MLTGGRRRRTVGALTVDSSQQTGRRRRRRQGCTRQSVSLSSSSSLVIHRRRPSYRRPSDVAEPLRRSVHWLTWSLALLRPSSPLWRHDRSPDHTCTRHTTVMTCTLQYNDVNPLTSLYVQSWASGCPEVKNYKWRLNQGMLYSCTRMATVGVKGLSTFGEEQICTAQYQHAEFRRHLKSKSRINKRS